MVASVFMTGESFLEEVLQEAAGGSEVLWATRIESDRVLLTLTGGTDEDRNRVLSRANRRFGSSLLRGGDVSPASLALEALRGAGVSLGIAESCTGGLLSKLLTDVPGSSDVLKGTAVAYDNNVKRSLLGVSEEILSSYGAVSRECAEAMATGAIDLFDADCGVVTTGIAGPTGGSAEKPVGTVWIVAAERGGRRIARRFLFQGSRGAVRKKAAIAALLLLEAMILGDKQLDIPVKG
jgi:PncC family amidohydrolase